MSGLVLAVASVMVLLSASRPPARCAGDDLLAIPGKWLPLRDENGRSPVPTGEFKQVSQRIERFDRLFRAAYPQPKGIQVEAYWSFRGSGKPYPYAFTSLYKAWYCNDNIDALMAEPNIYFASALLAMWRDQHETLDEEFTQESHRHWVSHFVWGDAVRSDWEEDRLFADRRRLLEYLKREDIERYRDLIAKLGLRR